MKKYDIVRFQKSENKITQPITKFGGQGKSVAGK